jgi:hypothetical protein
MRLLIDTRNVQFRVTGAAQPRMDYKDKDRQAKDRDGRLIWTVRLEPRSLRRPSHRARERHETAARPLNLPMTCAPTATRTRDLPLRRRSVTAWGGCRSQHSWPALPAKGLAVPTKPC